MFHDLASSTHPRGVRTGLASLCGLKACGECDMPHINYLGCSNKGKLWIMKVSSKGCTYLYEYNDVEVVPSGRQIDVDKSTLRKISTEVIKSQLVTTMLLLWHKCKDWNSWWEYVSGSTECAFMESISRLVRINVTFWENGKTFDLFIVIGIAVDDNKLHFSVTKLYMSSQV